MMLSRSLARGVIASLGVSVVITLGCGQSPGGQSPGGPSPVPTFSALSISPFEGSSVGATVATIAGTGFQSGDTVTVDGSRVDATVLSANTISLTMPAHAAGSVNVTVTNPLSQAQASVPRGYMYVGPPVINELVPNIGSTGGGTLVTIKGAGVGRAATVTVGGIASPIEIDGDTTDDPIYLSTPAHAPGAVEVILTDRYGQTGSGVFTYASPATFDFNGDWQGLVEHTSSRYTGLLTLTIRDNTVASVSCSVCRNGVTCESVPSPTLDPPPVVANGEFSFAGSGGVSITGKILSPNYASGSIDMASCVGRGQWWAQKRQ